MDSQATTADVVIVGGGSAGAVLAARLSAQAGRSVLLIEAGHDYPGSNYPDVLLDATRLGGDAAHDWGYTGRGGAKAPEIVAFRGKTIGGSSAVNAGIAMRARAADIAHWHETGVTGWSFDDLVQTWRALENTPSGLDEFHGRTGVFPIRQHTYTELTPSLRAFIDAAAGAGYPRIADFNAADQRGVGAFPRNVVDGIRQNTGLVYLTEEVRRRPDLRIIGDVTIDRVLFDGRTATGVLAADGREYRGRQVILSAGAYGSPAILLRSGIGPAAELRSLGIEVRVDLPVGLGLQDHPFYYTVYALAPEALDMSPAAGAVIWTASSEAVGDELDVQVTATHLVDASVSPTGGAIVLAMSVVQPDSRGTLRLRSRDPLDAPIIDSDFLAAPRDRRRMLEAVKLSRRLARGDVLGPLLAGELLPGEAVADDEALLDAIETNIASYGHPAATAPMGGPNDPMAVVDSAGAVRGVDGLRVVDASILPRIPSVAPNLTIIGMAEYLAGKAELG